MSSFAASESRDPSPADVPLEFASGAECLRWVETNAGLDYPRLHDNLIGQLVALSHAQLDPLERMRILEALRGIAASVQAIASRDYEGQPLPLDASGIASWNRALRTWHELKENYQISLAAFRDGRLEMAPHAPLIIMRCLHCLTESIAEHYRAYHKVPAALWRETNGMYSLSEEYGFARLAVRDGFSDRDPVSSCHDVYARALMLDLTNPYALSPRQVRFVREWLTKWASLVVLVAQSSPSQIPVVGIDLGGTRGVIYSNDLKDGASVRYLDLEQIAATLRLTLELLKQGQTPAQLGLGTDAHQPGCENLLMLLYLHWCRAGMVRTETREDTDTPAEICLGIAAICDALRQRRSATQSADAAAASGGNGTGPDGIAVQGEFASCRIMNYSTGGLMGLRHGEDRRGERIAHGQLIGVRRAGSQFHRAGIVQWMIAEGGDLLRFGVRLFPGIPEPVSVRPANPTAVPAPVFEDALLLPELPMPSTPSSLVLPSGSFTTGRVLEMRLESQTLVVTLLHTLDQGIDFERRVIKVL